MRLLRLEMQGFKSFADKTVIQFDEGVTGIVGPNGCGKSNIADAIRWVLGEQSLKNLRGSKSEDVIFAGSSDRRALNLAEVSLVFNNEDRFFGIDYEEVSIGRRIYRSGEGAYLLNRKVCRLKDIVDLFRDTGLGRDALAVLGQNKIDELLSCSPEDRRGAFEELAGISRYKNRKKEALRRLDQTEQNLLRVQDLMITMAEELPALEEAKRKTEVYQSIKKEMRAGEMRWFASEWTKLAEQEKKILEEEKSFHDLERLAQEFAQKHRSEMAQMTQKLDESDKVLGIWRSEKEEVQQRLQGIQTESAVQVERLQQNENLMQILGQDQSNKQEVQEKNQKEVAGQEIRLEELKLQYLAKKNEFKDAQAGQFKLHTQWKDIQSQLDLGREEGFSSLQKIVSLKNRNQTLLDDLERQKRRAEKMTQELSTLFQQKSEAEQELLQTEAARNRNEEASALELRKKEEASSLRAKLGEEKNALRSQLDEVRAREQNGRLRLRWLHDMIESHEGFSSGVRSLLQATASWRSGILGTVADLFQVEPEYRTALEVALGSGMQNVICRTDTEAREGIAYLKNKKAGRVTLLPLENLQVYDSKRETEFLSEIGCLGRASDFVSVSPEVEKAARFLLQRTLVVDKMQNALNLAKKSRFSVRIVTLEGEIIRPGGSMTGGSAGKEKDSFWGRRDEAEQLAEKLETQKRVILEVETKWSQLIIQLEQVERSLSESESHIQEYQMRARILEEQKNNQKLRWESIREELQRGEEESQEFSQEESKSRADLHQVVRELREAQELDEIRKEDILKLQTLVQQLDGEKEETQQKLTRLQVESFGSEQEYEHGKIKLEELKRLLITERSTLADIQKRMGEIESIKNSGSALLEELRKEQRDKQGRLTIIDEGLSKEEKNWQELFKQKEMKEKEQLEKEKDAIRLNEKKHEWELRFQRLSFEKEKWVHYLSEEFELTVTEALEQVDQDISLKGLADRLGVLKNRISEMGEVNPYAIEEYERHQERYSFYQTQSDDLGNAKQSLQRLLNELNREMASKFKETFENVQRRFERIFGELFGGGKAGLSLTEPNQILETGIEIFAQPPGKKLQNMTLLSGGERALTVIALLFAFMECRPSPFYLADEVDAALDEANVRRFGQFLKEYGAKNQFIVVTHRRGTMEAADILYGITMESAGISKLISVRFEDEELA